jgi:HEPN domain-containing protein
MNGDEEPERRREAAGWLAVAREDVRVVRACLTLNPPALGVAAYHCQQAAEKLAKGLLVAAAVAFRKTHDIDELADLVASNYPECRDLLHTIRPLTVWGIAYRYPAIEDIPEPVPDSAELHHTIGIIEQLAQRLHTATAVRSPDHPAEPAPEAMKEEPGQP